MKGVVFEVAAKQSLGQKLDENDDHIGVTMLIATVLQNLSTLRSLHALCCEQTAQLGEERPHSEIKKKNADIERCKERMFTSLGCDASGHRYIGTILDRIGLTLPYLEEIAAERNRKLDLCRLHTSKSTANETATFFDEFAKSEKREAVLILNLFEFIDIRPSHRPEVEGSWWDVWLALWGGISSTGPG
jgi:hypothetical protein